MTEIDTRSSAAEPERLSGPELRRFFAGGLEALRKGAQAVNNLNVFPVPDGDTGTNMVATLAGAVRAAAECQACDLGAVAAGLARGALLEARGNSGVILAQLLAGLAASFDGAAETGSEGWAAAWHQASQAAWRSVGTPMEGTVLTVVREAAAAAAAAADANLPLVAAWRFMADAADLAVQRTTRLLPVLEEAEVVDAGGLGLALVVRGGLAAFTGEPLPSLAGLPAPSARTRRVIAEASFPRYCTELVLTAANVDRSALDVRLRQLGDSLDLTNSGPGKPETTLHIHIHTDEPEALFAYAATLGTVSHRKVEDMEAQRARFLAGAGPLETGWVAVASGRGMRRVFENLPGVAGVVEALADEPLGAAELAVALAHASAAQLLLLANDPALWPAAQAAAAASARPARAILTATLPQGIAAALAFDPAVTLDDNAEAMLAAARGVRTVTASPEAFEAAEAEIATFGDGFSLVTLYTGAGASPEQAGELAIRLQRLFPGLETEVVEGGQPAPPLLLAVE
jgi:uncharacterized protein